MEYQDQLIETPSTVQTIPVIQHPPLEKPFKPKGAIAFFLLLVVLCLVIWFGIYYIMIARS